MGNTYRANECSDNGAFGSTPAGLCVAVPAGGGAGDFKRAALPWAQRRQRRKTESS